MGDLRPAHIVENRWRLYRKGAKSGDVLCRESDFPLSQRCRLALAKW